MSICDLIGSKLNRVISLTSIPSRFPRLQPTLQSLLEQDADEVRLYIPPSYRRFPDWDGKAPDVPRGVTLCFADQDYGPATKILPACSDLQGQDVQILFCDDDGTYAPSWAEALFSIQAERPQDAVAGYVRSAQGYVPNQVHPVKEPRVQEVPIKRDIPYRLARLSQKVFRTPAPWRRPIRKGGYGEIFFGVGGVVVRPDFFDEVAYEIPKEAWAVDDVWLSAQLARRGIAIYCPARHPMPREAGQSHTDSLLHLETDLGGRQELNRKAARYCQEKFGIWQS